MKKEIFMACTFSVLLIIVALCAKACDPTTKNLINVNAEINQTERIRFNNGIHHYDLDIITFSYKGHSYLIFDNVGYVDIIHNPDCPCHDAFKNKTNNSIYY